MVPEAGTRPLDIGEVCARFDAASAFTVGVEEELMLVDPATLDLAPAIEDVLRRVDHEPRIVRELRTVQVELVTSVCSGPAEAAGELAELRRLLVDRLEGSVRLLGAGTHPTAREWGAITEADRYRAIADEYGWAARRSLVCGLHVHVAVPGAARALAVFNAVRSFIPELAALTANSPFHEGHDTGLCSIRPKLNEALPRTGIPPAFESWGELTAYLDWARRGGLFPDAGFLWWDVRPHLVHGTLELRAADAQTNVQDAIAVTALFQALVVSLAQRFDDGEELPAHDAVRIAENAWRAYRSGIHAELVDLDTGEPEPARSRLARLLDELEPVADRLGSAPQLEDTRTLLAGNGADRQRYVQERDGMRGLLEWLVDETESA